MNDQRAPRILEQRFAEGPYWIGAKHFADLTGCSVRAAQKALKNAVAGRPWNGFSLRAREAGRSFELDARTLPEHLYRKLYEASQALRVPVPVSQPASDLDATQYAMNVELRTKQYQVAKWHAEIIEPALTFVRGTRGRGEALRALAERTHIRPTDGRPLRFSEATLRDFCARFEDGGVHALMRKPRRKEDQPRCRVNRRWDAECPLAESVKSRLADEIEDYVRGLWVAGAPSRGKVRMMASAELSRRCREAGWEEATPQRCDVGQYLIERCQDVRRVAVYHRDAKRFDDSFRPRIQRERSNFAPGDVIVGDVHPVDIYLKRPDGSTYTPRMIAWYDLATNRTFWTLLHCEPKRSVTQADVTQSFVELCMAWGIPRKLYLDNGSEYKWDAMVRGFEILAALGAELDVRIERAETLAAKWEREESEEDSGEVAESIEHVANRGRAIVRARPYNAAAKPIEGAFSAKEKVLAMLPGYIGGDRMRKHVAKVGGPAHTYEGTPEEFDRDFADAMAFFHSIPQRGHLKGMSPDEAFAAMRSESTAPIANPVVFLIAFSEEKTLKVRTQGVQLGAREGGRWYYGDELIPLIGTRQRFRIAKWSPEQIVLVRTGSAGEYYTAIHEARAFGFFDQEGAKEASRREGIAKRHIREMRKTAPAIDLTQAMRTVVEEIQRGSPELLPVPPQRVRRIALTPELKALSEQLDGGNPNPPIKLGPGEFRDAEGVVHQLPSRSEILLEEVDAGSHARLLSDYKVERPEPKPKSPFDAEEIGRKALEEIRRKKQAGSTGSHPPDLIQPFAVARTKKENEV
jgi:hypothetical protein